MKPTIPFPAFFDRCNKIVHWGTRHGVRNIVTTFLITNLLAFATAYGAPSNVAELFVTPENLQLVRQADKVDVCILRHIEPKARTDGSIDRSTERYEETVFTPVPTGTANALRDLVLNEKTYDWKAGSGGRKPQFYLRLRFHRGGEMIAIDFCFLCQVLNVTKRGEELGHTNFGRNGDLFLQAFLKIFPDDPPLQHVAKEAGLPP